MKRGIRKIIAVMLIACLTFVCGPIASMAETVVTSDEKGFGDIQPRLTYIVEAEADMIMNGTSVTVDCWVNGHVNSATKAKVIAELQVKSGSNWIAYGTWTDTQNDYEAYVYETKDVKKGNTYRVKATVTVWEGSASEELILFTDEKTA